MTADSPTRPDTAPAPWARLATAGLLVVNAASCLLASALHFGLGLRVGQLVLAEPPLLAAAIVEGAVGLGLVAGLGAMLGGARRARQIVVGAYVFGVVGFLVGLSAVLRNPGMATPFNLGVHVIVLPLLVVGLAIVLLAGGSVEMGHRERR